VSATYTSIFYFTIPNTLSNPNFCYFRAQVKEEPEEIEAQESDTQMLTELSRLEK
tara:strand:- start:748 stop:912 length:165 start_codon:yes stop_codon:yes gene_type:complete